MIQIQPGRTQAETDAAAEYSQYERAVRGRRAWQLTHLIQEMGTYGLTAQLAYDTRGGVRAEFVTPKTDLGPIEIRDDGAGEYYRWNTDTGKHPVCDPAGAARRIATARHGVRASFQEAGL